MVLLPARFSRDASPREVLLLKMLLLGFMLALHLIGADDDIGIQLRPTQPNTDAAELNLTSWRNLSAVM